jgi:hypothetical protein
MATKSTKLTGDAARVSKLAQSLGASKEKAEGAVRTSLSSSSSGVQNMPTKPAYNAETGASTGTPSKEYNDYLKSLNKKGSSNYVPVDDELTTTTAPVAPTAPITPTSTTPTPTSTPSNITDMTREGWTPTSAVASDMSQNYRTIANNPPKNINIDSGAESKQAVGTALATTQGPTPPQKGLEYMNSVDTGENKDIATIEKIAKDYWSPKNQKDSLMTTYKEMVSSFGLDDINAELIDAKNIIDGTEDDIRTEITKAGGFATESQVQGMTNARNKSLIKNYNTLLETKNAITEQIGNMMQYAQADRQYAAQQFESRMNFEMKKIEYGQQAKQYAAEQLGKIVDTVGYSGLLSMTGGDAYTTNKIEQALGLGNGGLAKLAGGSGTNVTPTGTIDPKEAEAINIILGSGKFTKDQSNAIRNSISNGEDPFAVIKNQAKALMTGANQTKIESYETSQDALNNIEKTLKEFYGAGGKTNIFTGNYEKVVNKLGEVSDPKLVELATQIQQNLQIYRNAVSGTAYSVQEGADIASIFPGINKTQGLNQAIINGRKAAFKDGIDGAYRGVLGKVYDQFKQSESAGQGMPKGSMSDAVFVESSLKSQNLNYQNIINNTPSGQKAVLDNATGQVGYIPYAEFNSSKYTSL